MTAGQIRSMPQDQAIMLATAMRPALVKLQRWFDGPDAARISAAFDAAKEAGRKRARRAGAPFNEERGAAA